MAFSLKIHRDRFMVTEVLACRCSGEFSRLAKRKKDWEIAGWITLCPMGATGTPLIVTMVSGGPLTSQLNIDEPNGETIFGIASNLTLMGSDISASNWSLKPVCRNMRASLSLRS